MILGHTLRPMIRGKTVRKALLSGEFPLRTTSSSACSDTGRASAGVPGTLLQVPGHWSNTYILSHIDGLQAAGAGGVFSNTMGLAVSKQVLST